MKTFYRYAALVAGSLLGLCACSSDDDVADASGKTPVAQPQVIVSELTTTGFKIRWEAVEGAGAYVYTFNGSEETSTDACQLSFGDLERQKEYVVAVKATPKFADENTESPYTYVHVVTDDLEQLPRPKITLGCAYASKTLITWTEVPETALYEYTIGGETYTTTDRMVTLGCMPVHETVSIDKGIDVWANFGTHYFLERREIGMFNIGKDSTGIVVADGVKYELGYKDCLYITQGTKEVTFASADPEHPAKFYMVSAPAHCSYETRLIKMADANHRPLGSVETCNKRTINQFIHPDVLKTCQLSMGMTELEPGSNWNTMPSHTHERRMEIYTYFELPEGQVVFHMCGEPTQTRHIVMHNEDAVISPSWSIHSGVGTSNYTFIWAMGGENMEFDDMDNIATTDLR